MRGPLSDSLGLTGYVATATLFSVLVLLQLRHARSEPLNRTMLVACGITVLWSGLPRSIRTGLALWGGMATVMAGLTVAVSSVTAVLPTVALWVNRGLLLGSLTVRHSLGWLIV